MLMEHYLKVIPNILVHGYLGALLLNITSMGMQDLLMIDLVDITVAR
jgi:hypothetical protein